MTIAVYWDIKQQEDKSWLMYSEVPMIEKLPLVLKLKKKSSMFINVLLPIFWMMRSFTGLCCE